MFPFWESVIAPVLKAAGAKRIVEIGALRGETTALLLDDLGPDAELHVIDPLPQFDPAEHERALPRPLRLPPRPQPRRAATARADGRGADRRRPQLVHGAQRAADARRGRPRRRRDAAGAGHARRRAGRTAGATSTTRPTGSPSPSASRTASAGMRARPQASSRSNAAGSTRRWPTPTHEGGPRNGVMTALDDFIAEHDRAAAASSSCRSTSASRSSPRSAGSRPRRSWPRSSTGSRARRCRLELLELAESLRLQAVVMPSTPPSTASADRARASGQPLPRDRCRRGAARRAPPRERDPARVPGLVRRRTAAIPTPTVLRDPAAPHLPAS